MFSSQQGVKDACDAGLGGTWSCYLAGGAVIYVVG